MKPSRAKRKAAVRRWVRGWMALGPDVTEREALSELRVALRCYGMESDVIGLPRGPLRWMAKGARERWWKRWGVRIFAELEAQKRRAQVAEIVGMHGLTRTPVDCTDEVERLLAKPLEWDPKPAGPRELLADLQGELRRLGESGGALPMPGDVEIRRIYPTAARKSGICVDGQPLSSTPLTVFDGSPQTREHAVAVLGTPLADELERSAKERVGKPNGVYEVSVRAEWDGKPPAPAPLEGVITLASKHRGTPGLRDAFEQLRAAREARPMEVLEYTVHSEDRGFIMHNVVAAEDEVLRSLSLGELESAGVELTTPLSAVCAAGNAELLAELDAKIENAVLGPPSVFYLSFADESPPKGKGWLGSAYVDAHTELEAVKLAWMRGINPGGEVAMLELPSDLRPRLPAEWRNRLLTRAELDEIDKLLEDKPS